MTGEGLLEPRSAGIESFSNLREGFEDLWRDFSFDLGVSESLFRSFSAGGFEGMVEGGGEEVRRSICGSLEVDF